MRLFIALNIPKKQRERIHRAARPLREDGLPVRWIEADNYHVTLKFLGEARREAIPRIEERLGDIARATPSFVTPFGGFGAFPTIRRPRVLWLGVGASPELRCLKQDMEWSLGDLGFAAETRAFHPHVTLGRAGASGGAGDFRGLEARIADIPFQGELKVHTVDLMRSHLSREGARYSVVAGIRLATK